VRALIVEEGLSRGALAGARGLARESWSIGVASPVRGLASSSRFTTRWHRIPSLKDGSQPFRDTLERVIDSEGYEVVFPAGDAELLELSAMRDRLSAVVPLSPHASLLRGMDKLELVSAGGRAGFSVPRTVKPDEAISGILGWPVVVKPRLHYTGSRLTRFPTRIVSSEPELREHVSRIEAHGGEAVVQEHISGRLCAWVALVADSGALRAQFQQVAERTHPAGIGVTSRGRSVPVAPEVTEAGHRLLNDLGWVGLAQLQFIAPQGGQPRLIDLNARFYGSMALALAAGVNFPAMWAAAATNRRVPAAVAAPGTCFQWLEGDLRTAYALRGRKRVRELAATLGWATRSAHGVWRLDDPVPAVVYGRAAARRARSAGLARGGIQA
jgi:predicted ATP-grasp superfamily ATP-dependent carboligase